MANADPSKPGGFVPATLAAAAGVEPRCKIPEPGLDVVELRRNDPGAAGDVELVNVGDAG